MSDNIDEEVVLERLEQLKDEIYFLIESRDVNKRRETNYLLGTIYFELEKLNKYIAEDVFHSRTIISQTTLEEI